MHKHIKVTYFDNNPVVYCNGEKANEEEIINCLVESFEEKGNLVKKIRELKKENEELKTFLEAMREELSLADRENTALEKENEELKQDCKNYIWYKQVKTLTNENEQLKRKYQRLFDVIECLEKGSCRSIDTFLDAYCSDDLLREYDLLDERSCKNEI